MANPRVSSHLDCLVQGKQDEDTLIVLDAKGDTFISGCTACILLNKKYNLSLQNSANWLY